MGFLAIGVAMTLLKLFDVPFMASVGWLWVGLPYVLAVLWWWIADASGLTQRRQMADQDEKARERRDRHYEAMGMRAPRRSPGDKPYQSYPKHRN